MVTSLWQVPGEQLGQFIDSPEQVDQFLTGLDDKGCYLDKSIDGIQFLLDRAGVPVYLAPTDMPGEPIDVDGEIYFGLWVDLVKQIAENLRANSFDVLAPHFDSEKMNRAEVYPTPGGPRTTSTTCASTTTAWCSFSTAPRLPTPRCS